MKLRNLAIVIGIVPAFIVAPAASQDPEPALHEAAAAGIAVAAGSVLHELGHALIIELDLPVIGPEEDGADAIATLELLRILDSIAASTAWSEDDLMAIVRYWATAWHYFNTMVAGAQEPTMFSRHSPNARRFGNTLCLVYGGDPERFQWLVERFWPFYTRQPDGSLLRQDFDEDYRAMCVSEYRRQLIAYFRLQEPHFADPVGATEGGRITRFFEELGDDEQWEHWPDVLGFIETTIEIWNHIIAWPRDVKVAVRHCEHFGQYSPQDAEVTVCYGMIRQWADAVRLGNWLDTPAVGPE